MLPTFAWAQPPADAPPEDATTEDPAEAPAQPPLDHTPDKRLDPHRTAFEALTERAIGQTSRRVRFDWRRSPIQVAINGGLPAELNNFDSLRAGAMVRFPAAGVLMSVGASWVHVRSSESTDQLALTPYRQPGRPSRIELDYDLIYPIAEGVSTAFLGFFPSTELVLNAHARFRYNLYPGGWDGLGFQDSLRAILNRRLSQQELENLEDDRLPGMEIDRGRYGILAGIGNDLYFQSGFFFSSQIMIALPILRFMTETKLGYGYELDLSMGLAF